MCVFSASDWSRHRCGVRFDEEKRMAEVTAWSYLQGAVVERTPEPDEYEAIANMVSMTIDVHMFLTEGLYHACVNPGQTNTVKVLYTTLGGCSLRDGAGHFDRLLEDDMVAPGSDQTHQGFGR